MDRWFVDTSAWFAYVNAADTDHKAVSRTLKRAAVRLLTTNFVFDETVTLCARRLGHNVAERVGETLRDPEVVDMIRLTADDEEAAWQLFLERPDKGYSFTDCTSFVTMRLRSLQTAIAVDDDFKREGFVTLPRR
jgi:predicted nucleic acid-binding protein